MRICIRCWRNLCSAYKTINSTEYYKNKKGFYSIKNRAFFHKFYLSIPKTSQFLTNKNETSSTNISDLEIKIPVILSISFKVIFSLSNFSIIPNFSEYDFSYSKCTNILFSKLLLFSFLQYLEKFFLNLYLLFLLNSFCH